MGESIIISEVTHTGEVHYQVNSCFLEMISSIKSNQQLYFISESYHNEVVKKGIEIGENDNIIFKPFTPYYDEKQFKWLDKIIGECVQIFKIVKFGRKIGAEEFIWTCLFPTGHLFLSFINLFSSKKHTVILHGELELLTNTKKRKVEKFLRIILRLALKMGSKNTRYIVLGSSIKENMKDVITKMVLEKTFSILHPYRYDLSLEQKQMESSISIGAIGTQMRTKNSHFIYELAKFCNSEIKAEKLKFYTIGKVLPEINNYKNDLVENFYSNSFVDQKEFEKAISKLDFIVFFYNNSGYKLCASGAIFEAIRLNKPIISLRNDYFEWIFNTYGEMGFLCDSLEEMKGVVKELSSAAQTDKIELIYKNLALFKENNSLEQLARNLKEKLE